MSDFLTTSDNVHFLRVATIQLIPPCVNNPLGNYLLGHFSLHHYQVSAGVQKKKKSEKNKWQFNLLEMTVFAPLVQTSEQSHLLVLLCSALGLIRVG